MHNQLTVLRTPLLRWIVLSGLFLFAIAYQGRMMRYSCPQRFGDPTAAAWPFSLQPSPSGFILRWPKVEASEAGLQDGDILVSVEGKQALGSSVAGDALNSAHSGQALHLAVRPVRSNATFPKQPVDVSLRFSALQSSPLPEAIGSLLMPLFCLCLGFWVARIRPNDPVAWLLLVLLLSFATFANERSAPSALLSWSPLFRLLGTIYYVGSSATWPLWMLLFGYYFPERFPANARYPWWNWAKAAIGIPLAAIALARVIYSIGEIENLASVLWLGSLLRFVDRPAFFLTLAGFACFFLFLIVKFHLAVSKDGKRRLRLLFAGATVSMAPLFATVVISRVKGVQPSTFGFATTMAELMVFLFPATLAYAIMVQRAMDVRIVVREGLRYAIAKNSARILQAVAVILAAAAATTLVSDWHTYRSAKFAVLLIGLTVMLVLRGEGRTLRKWVDLLFFRDALKVEMVVRQLCESTLQQDDFLDSESLLKPVLHTVASAFDGAEPLLFLPVGDRYEARPTGEDSPPTPLSFPLKGQIVENMLRSCRAIHVYFDDEKSWVHDLPRQEQETLRAGRTEVALPLARSDKFFGLISVAAKKSGEPFSSSDLELLDIIARQTALRLENLALISSLSGEIAARERKMAEKTAADDANKAKSEFMARMSHEFRTPLNAIIGYSEMLQEEADENGDETLVSDLNKIRIAGKHLLSLINSILDMSKIEAGKTELYLEVFGVEKMVRDTLTIIEPLVTKAGNKLRCEISADAGTMTADLVKVRQVLFNLLSNATKFTQNGVILLSVCAERLSDAG